MPTSLPSPSCHTFYLFGEDRDALSEHADALLAEGDSHVLRLRLDASEWFRIEEEQRNQSLFGVQPCYALVRNAESATPKQGEHLLQLAQNTASPHRLIICAPNIAWKKIIHKKMRGLKNIQQQEFSTPSLHRFHAWLVDEIKQAGLHVDEAGLNMVAENLCGMRLAARQWIERLLLYRGDERIPISLAVMTALLGEHAPDDLDDWVHQVAMRQASSLRLTHRLLYDQQVNEVQMHAWLSIRFQQLLMYRWYHAKRHPRALQAAKVFGNAVRLVPQESEQWQAQELMDVMTTLQDSETLLKGASIEDKKVVLERLVLRLLGKK
ncbi:MAG: DNA polymerase III subunit delta [Zetaproteobacteria bacterium]|nr:DNA polymerase III subunit delta [Zetaproteobacteria bacterium]